MVPAMRSSKKYDSVRKIVCLLFAVILFIPLLLVGGTASAASGWSNIDGNGVNGINVNPIYKAENPAIAEWNGEVYVAWQERITPDANSKNQIRVKKYNGTGWVSVDGNGPNGLNADVTKVASRPAMAVYDDALYITWTEMVTSSVGQVRIKKYDGISWTSAEGDSLVGINVDPSKSAIAPSLAVYKEELYATWAEASQIRVRKYDGTEWTSVDGGGTTGLNVSPTSGAGGPVMAVLGDALYAAWSELSGSNYQIRVKKYDGNSWTLIDGGGSGLNVRGWSSATSPSVTVMDDVLYVAWVEPIGRTDDQIRVKKFDGSTWSSIDGGGEQGINVNTGYRAWEVELAAIDNELYAIWSENTGVYVNRQYVFKIRVKKYDGTKWTSAEDGKNGLNVSGERLATNPEATVLDGVLYVAWSEWNSVEEQVRVARYLPPPPPAVNSVSVNPGTANIARGASKQLTAAVDAVGGAVTTVTWSSSDASNKVAVDNTGNVTVAADAAPGPYTITATSTADSSKTGTSTITVTYAPAVNSVTVTPDSANVMQGETRQLTAAVDAVGGAATTVTWSSSDAGNKVAVSSTGNVTVAADAAPGPYTITATSTADRSKTGTATITVTYAPAVNSVMVTPDSANVMQGESRQLTAAVDAVGGAATTVTWTSSDASNKVAVSSTGNVTVAADAAPGPYTITATSTADRSKTGTSTITVTYAPAVNGVTVTPDSANVMQGESRQLTAAVDAVGGAGTTVTWSSSDDSNKVAVSSTGNVTVAADASPGPYTITATSTADSSKTGTASITVTYAPAVNGVTVTPDSANVMQGESRQLTAAVDAVGGAATTVTWSSSDTSNKVAVSSTGNVTVAADAAPGPYTITATSTADNSKTGTSTITVTAAPTYTIAALTNQTLTALIQGYVSGTQDAKTIPVTNIGTGNLTNLSVSTSGANANDFVITQPDSGLNSSESTSFTIQAKDGLSAGTYTVTVTVSADQMTAVTFTVTQSVNLPNAPANPQGLVAVGGDRQVTLNWNTVTGATYYNIYTATSPGQFTEDEAVTVTSSTYSVQNLINGKAYYFVVKAGNAGGLGAMSNEVGTTPATIPAEPTNLTVTAGDGQATVTFTAPTDDGGSPITGYEVTAAPGNVVVTGSSSPIVVTGLSNGTSYIFTVKAINAAGISISSAESNSVVPRSSSSGESGTSEPSASTTPETTDRGVDILINGKVENAGTAATSKRNDQSVRTVFVDQKKLEDKLAAEGQGAVVTIPVSAKSDVVIGELNGQMVKSMESKQAVVAVKTDQATYTIPAQQIQIGDIADKLGKSIALQDIKVQIEIAAPTEDTVKVVEDAAANGTFTIMVSPLDFTIRATYGDTTVDVSKFNAYVERTIAIPAGVDPNKITTGVVVEPDGTVRHVPTKVVIIDGKYYAQINSLTNSTYSVVWHPLEFLDVANHWAKDSVNDMGSRMVIDGTGGSLFNPDRDITRAEFAAIVVRGLGLKPEKGSTAFTDVKTSDWFSSAIDTAYAYQLIAGFEDGTFRPNEKITREQAMTILSRAMTITGLKAKLSAQSEDETLRPFEDAPNVSGWALSSVADSVQAGLVSGRTATELAPKAPITRAEVAAIVQRLLQKSGLI